MSSTEAASEEPDKFARLFELKASERDLLFNEKHVRLGAMLIASDRGRFEKLLDVLKGNGVGRLRQWEQECRKQLKAAQQRAAKKAAAKTPTSGKPVIDYRAPLDTARLFLDQHHPNLIQFHGDWLDHDGSAYAELEDRTVRQSLQRFLETSVTLDPQDGSLTPVKVSGPLVASVMEVMANDVHVARNTYSPPCWLDPRDDDPPAREVLAFPNGLLHIPSGEIIAATPRFFTFSALPFAYEPDAPEPARWLQCLQEWWPESQESRDCLQEIFGYLLLPDTSLQKIFMLVGASRGGKGTVSRVLTHLIGAGNHVSPTLDQLSQPFGMQAMIGKQLATLTDLYVHRANKASIAVENLLRISGEDDVTVQRKHKTDWIGRLSVRFLLAGTVAPVLPDMSGSLANRYVPLLMKQTFVNREDPHLFEGKLVPEMPGILNWAIAGWRRLKERGHFVLTEEGANLVRELRALANPVEAFLRECCVVEKGALVKKDELFAAFEHWSAQIDGLSFQFMEQKDFSRRLVAASGYRVGETRPRTGDDGRQEWHYTNVRLRPESLPATE